MSPCSAVAARGAFCAPRALALVIAAVQDQPAADVAALYRAGHAFDGAAAQTVDWLRTTL